jgi:D-proline reductase (dithiol) PrdB
MSFAYLPVMAQNSAPRAPRVLVQPTRRAWRPLTIPLAAAKIALLSSAALRTANQQPFVPREDLSYRRVPSDPNNGKIVIDHHSGIGTVPKQDPEIVFPRTALAALAQSGAIGAVAPFHFSLMGGVRAQRQIEDELAPALAAELEKSGVDLALLVPY